MSGNSELLIQLSDSCGQSPWVDNLKRSYLTNGTLKGLVERGIRGVTSNPSIFQKAIAGSTDYDEAFGTLVKSGSTVPDAYWTMVVEDVANACDQLDEVFDSSAGVDGYVSLEVSPTLAHDTAGTVQSALALKARVAKGNVMIKVPATAAGVGAVRELIAGGLDINVTLIFSIERYAEVIEAYISGLEDRAAAGEKDLSGTASVASFFISRVDSEVDKRLAALGTPKAKALEGKAAVSQGVLAYQLFLSQFSGPRWDKLARLGARVQRPLWASTSTKNPAYPDTLYVDALIGPNTVNTLPEVTLEAFADHGHPSRSIDTVESITAAYQAFASLREAGIDMSDVANVLETEGVAAFVKSFEDLLSTLTARSAEVAK